MAYVFIPTCMNEYLKDLGVDGSIILKQILNKYRRDGMDLIELAQRRGK